MRILDVPAMSDLIHRARMKHQGTFSAFLWWSGYVHNQQPKDMFKSAALEPAHATLVRNLGFCERRLRDMYEYTKMAVFDARDCERRCQIRCSSRTGNDG